MFATFVDAGGLEYRLDVENSIYLRFDAAHRCFNVTSKDGERLLTSSIETELQKRGWKYYESIRDTRVDHRVGGGSIGTGGEFDVALR